MLILLYRYYSSAALGALFSYLSQQGESFAVHSLRIEYQALEGESRISPWAVGRDIINARFVHAYRHHAYRFRYGE